MGLCIEFIHNPLYPKKYSRQRNTILISIRMNDPRINYCESCVSASSEQQSKEKVILKSQVQ